MISLSLMTVSINLFHAQSIGPQAGTCIIIGGGSLDASIYHAFATAAGGFDQQIVVIPTAASENPAEHDPGFIRLRKRFEDQGFSRITILHTTEPEIANQDTFVAQLQMAKGIWFTGGRQWRLVDAYGGTRTKQAFDEVLARGGVIAGTSAGATIQGSFLARGDTKTNTIMMGDHQKGFGFIKSVAIDQHLLRRNRHYDLLEILEVYPNLLGIGLDENTAMVIKGDKATVIGQSYVVMYDRTKYDDISNTFIPDAGAFHFLAPGQAYDLKNRTIIREED